MATLTVKDAIIQVNQYLQDIDTFVYEDISPTEVCRALDYTLINIQKDYMTKLSGMKPEFKFESDEYYLMITERLIKRDIKILPTSNLTSSRPNYYIDLTNYVMSYGGNTNSVWNPKMLQLLNDASLIGVTCKVAGVNTTKQQVAANTLCGISNLNNTLDNTLSGTKKNKPVSNLANGILQVYTDGDFTVDFVYIDYLQVPPRFTNGFTITGDTSTSINILDLSDTGFMWVGMPVSGSGVVAGSTIASIVSNVSITLSIATTSTLNNTPLTFGTLGSAPMFLSDAANYELINQTCKYLSKVTEQSQQKIVNLETT